jgi:uncharacterized protein (DUF1697 family)
MSPRSGRARIVKRYVALLRGINVGGRKMIRMDDLRSLFIALGCDDVRTYLQSGNLIFSSEVDKESRFAREIENRIARDLDMTVKVLLRSSDDLDRIVAGNPFLRRKKIDRSKLHATFLAQDPKPARVATMETPAGIPDELSLGEREIFLHCPNGYGRTRLNNAFVEKALGVAATTRSWKSVTKLRDLAGGETK